MDVFVCIHVPRCVYTPAKTEPPLTPPTSPHFDAPGSLKPWSSATKLRCVWRTSATSWRITPSVISTLTSPTAPTRSTSNVPCRSCREWGLCTPSPPHASPARPTSSQSQSDSVPRSPPFCRNSNAAFREVLREIEKRPACGGLPMISFLILPMQRVTRLPLLTDVSMGWGWEGRLGCCCCHGNPPGGPAFSVASLTSFLTLTDV